MALGATRWIVGTVLGCAVVAALILPPQEPSRRVYRYGRETPPEVRAERFLTRELARATARLHLLEQRDSILERFRETGAPDTSPITIMVDDRLPSSFGEVLRSILSAPRRRLEAARGSGITTIVAVVVDTATTEVPRARSDNIAIDYLMPRATDGRTCLTLITAGPRLARNVWLGRARPESVLVKGGRWGSSWRPYGNPPLPGYLGPCAYYTAFGAPGDSIESWLQTAEFWVARNPAWAFYEGLPDLAQRGVPRSLAEARRLDYRWSFRGGEFYSCAAGNERLCRAAVSGDPQQWVFGVGTLRPPTGWAVVSAASLSWRSHPLGRQRGTFLSDLIADMGPDRFREFWRSGLPVDSAFSVSMGVPIEEWTMRWARSQIGMPKRGAPINVGATLLGLLLSGVFVGGAAAWATRRTVA